MIRLRSSSWLALSFALAATFLHASAAHAQDARSEGAPTVRLGVQQLQWAPGPIPELWAAPAAGLGVGGLSIALAVVLGQVASANYHEAIDPMTTQARASSLAGTIPDLSLAANILFAVGGGLATIGAIWLVILPFSQHPVTPEGPTVRASLGPTGFSLSGTF